MASISGTIQFDDGCIGDSQFSNSASKRLDADKMQHVYSTLENFNKAVGDTPVSVHVIHRTIRQSGTIRKFCAGLWAVGSASSMTFDLLKNGVSILSAPITVTNANTNKAANEGTISSPTVAAGDLLSIQLTVSTSTGATGPFAQVDVEESAAP